MTGRWLATQRAAHTRAMGAPQAFLLLGDGADTRGALMRSHGIDEAGDSLTGAALAEARYRDWFSARATGEHDAVTAREGYTAPTLELTPDDAPAATQSRLVIPPAQRARAAADRDGRLAEAERIIRALVDEFGDLFPDELAAAARWLKAATPT